MHYFRRLRYFSRINRSGVNFVLSFVLVLLPRNLRQLPFSPLPPHLPPPPLYHDAVILNCVSIPLGGTPFPPPLPIPHPIRFLCRLFLSGRRETEPFFGANHCRSTVVSFQSLTSSTLLLPPPPISDVAIIKSCFPFHPASCYSAYHPLVNSGTKPRGGGGLTRNQTRSCPFIHWPLLLHRYDIPVQVPTAADVSLTPPPPSYGASLRPASVQPPSASSVNLSFYLDSSASLSSFSALASADWHCLFRAAAPLPLSSASIKLGHDQ